MGSGCAGLVSGGARLKQLQPKLADYYREQEKLKVQFFAGGQAWEGLPLTGSGTLDDLPYDQIRAGMPWKMRSAKSHHVNEPVWCKCREQGAFSPGLPFAFYGA